MHVYQLLPLKEQKSFIQIVFVPLQGDIVFILLVFSTGRPVCRYIQVLTVMPMDKDALSDTEKSFTLLN